MDDNISDIPELPQLFASLDRRISGFGIATIPRQLNRIVHVDPSRRSSSFKSFTLELAIASKAYHAHGCTGLRLLLL
jgi:hypothetical protein